MNNGVILEPDFKRRSAMGSDLALGCCESKRIGFGEPLRRLITVAERRPECSRGFQPTAETRSGTRRGATIENLQPVTIMANTYTSLHYHIIFSTKHRNRWIVPDIEQRIWAYLGGIARQNSVTALLIGGVEDHIHILASIPPSISISSAVKEIKGGSSGWIKKTFPNLTGFAWQDGYGAFSVSKSQVPDVSAYIKSQREHHRVKTFQEEYRAFLDRHEIDYKEEYLWD